MIPLERKLTISDPAFKITRLTSRVSALMSNITNPEALTRPRPFTRPPCSDPFISRAACSWCLFFRRRAATYLSLWELRALRRL